MTSSHRKRSRREDAGAAESPSVTSVKKRRLDAAGQSSPSTPKAIRAITAAISGAFGQRRQASGAAGRSRSPDQVWEVPDSDNESKARRSAPKSRTRGQGGNDVHDVADAPGQRSPNDSPAIAPAEKSRTVAPRPKTERGATTSTGLSKKITRRSNRNHDKDAEKPAEGELEPEETPSKPRSKRPSKSTPRIQNSEPDARAESSTDELEVETPGNRRRKEVRDDALPIAAPNLRGILTPQKNRAGRRKSVAFETTSHKKTAEVYFEDLPSKAAMSAAKPSKGSARLAKPSQGELAQSNSVEQDTGGKHEEEKEERDEQEEEDDEDDEVCAICSKPDSEPPNEILFCDNCDMAIHQECYDVPIIPKGDWLCRECGQEEPNNSGLRTTMTGTNCDGPTTIARVAQIPEIPNFALHLRSTQRILLDRCSGRRRIRLRGHDEAVDKTAQLIHQTVLAGEGNSMLVIGARGCGKTALVEGIISELSEEHKDDFHVVRLNGFIHTDDKLALKEIWRQLGKEMEVEDELINKTNNYADTLASLLALLSHPSEMAENLDGVTTQSVIFIIDEFDLFATHARQTLLYNLFDIAQARKAPIAVLGLTTRIDVVQSLEKRVKSRFSHRYVYLSLPKSPPAYWDICKQALIIDDEDVVNEAGLDATVEGYGQFQQWWSERIEALYQKPAFQDQLDYYFYSSKSVAAFFTTCILPLASLTPTSPILTMPAPGSDGVVSPEAPDSKLHLLESLSDLDLSLLIAAARLDIVAHTDTVNFAMAYDEYTSLVGRQRAQSASAGMLALGGGSRVWGRGVAAIAWEQLITLGLLLPAGIGSRASAGMGGLEAKMWKVDVALEEIPAAVRMNAVLARWCKEI